MLINHLILWSILAVHNSFIIEESNWRSVWFCCTFSVLLRSRGERDFHCVAHDCVLRSYPQTHIPALVMAFLASFCRCLHIEANHNRVHFCSCASQLWNEFYWDKSYLRIFRLNDLIWGVRDSCVFGHFASSQTSVIWHCFVPLTGSSKSQEPLGRTQLSTNILLSLERQNR
jgi:hypothetical protein